MTVNDMTLNEFAADVHANARAHGWYDSEVRFPEQIALMHSELSEALQDYRCGYPVMACQGSCQNEFSCAECYANEHVRRKPMGLAVELADVMLRILDTCAYMKIDIEPVLAIKHEYNKTREYRHGGKRI